MIDRQLRKAHQHLGTFLTWLRFGYGVGNMQIEIDEGIEPEGQGLTHIKLKEWDYNFFMLIGY